MSVRTILEWVTPDLPGEQAYYLHIDQRHLCYNTSCVCVCVYIHKLCYCLVNVQMLGLLPR